VLNRGLPVPQPPLGDLQEPGGARVERLRRQRREARTELSLDQLGLLLRAAGTLIRGRDPAPGEQVPDDRADHNPQQQHGNEAHVTQYWHKAAGIPPSTR
jgi:hypothetical protein